MYGTPAAAAPRTAASSPSGWARPCTAIGATATGNATGTPSMVVDGSTDETSTRTRGRNRRRRHAVSFSSSVISSQEPPAT